MYTKDSVREYSFGAIKFAVKNYRGVYFLSDEVKEKIKNLTVEQAKRANKDAWKQKTESAKLTHRYSNWSTAGNISAYEEASSLYQVADQICKETYKRMMGYI